MLLVLDQYRPGTLGGRPCWRPPAESIAGIGLASAAQIAESRPDQPRWGGLFLCRDVPYDLADTGGEVLCWGHPRDWRFDTEALDDLERVTGYRPRGDRGTDCILDLLTFGSDPAGLDRPFPLEPTADGRLEVELGTYRAARQFLWRRDSYATNLVWAWRLRLNRVRNQAAAGELVGTDGQPDYNAHRKFADALVEKIVGLDRARKSDCWAWLKPAEWWRGEDLLPHETAYSDNFNRTTGLGSNWNIVYGFPQISSNKVVNTLSGVFPPGTGVGVAGWVNSLSSADMNASVDVLAGPGASAGVGPLIRGNADQSSAYLFLLTSNTAVAQLYSIVALAFTQLGSNVAYTFSSPDTALVMASGTTISGRINGTEVISVTDSSIDGATVGGKRCGFYIENVNGELDNFSMQDNSGATTSQLGGLGSPAQTPQRIVRVVGY